MVLSRNLEGTGCMWASVRNHRTDLWLCAALGILTYFAFRDSLHYQFLNWDDPAYITYNDLIKSWSFQNLTGIATEVVTRNYAPVTIFSFLLDHTIWGMNPAGYRFTNFALHFLNGLLAFQLLKQLGCTRFVAWAAASLFLIHPIQMESVVWISSRKGLLCTAFMLGAGIVRLRPSPEGRHEAWYLLWLVLALLSKAQAVILAPMIMLYDLVVAKHKLVDTIPRHFIPALVSFLLLLMTMGAQNMVLGGVRGHMELGLPQILAVDVTILWQYVGKLFWPMDLCVMYDPPTSGIWKQVLVGLAGWLAVGAVFWKIRRSQPLAIYGAACISLLLFPVLNFFRITTLMNDRYLYLPCLIVFAIFFGILDRAFSWFNGHVLTRVTAIGLRTAVTGACLGGAMVAGAGYLPVWNSPFDLWTHTLTCYPNMPIARIQMALTEYDSGRVSTAVEQMRAALRECEPDELDRERMNVFLEEWEREAAKKRPPEELKTPDLLSSSM